MAQINSSLPGDSFVYKWDISGLDDALKPVRHQAIY